MRTGSNARNPSSQRGTANVVNAIRDPPFACRALGYVCLLWPSLVLAQQPSTSPYPHALPTPTGYGGKMQGDATRGMGTAQGQGRIEIDAS